MRVAILCRRGDPRNKCHWVSSPDYGRDDQPFPAPGTIISGGSLCPAIGWHDDWEVVDRRIVRDDPDRQCWRCG